MEKEGPNALEMGKEEAQEAQEEDAEKGRRALGSPNQFLVLFYKRLSLSF